jgi:hypothetical protein
MDADRGQRCNGPAGKQVAKDLDVAELARRSSVADSMRCGQGLALETRLPAS